ncbi:MAG: sigma-70 family RNA polymerase sigma factor [Oscillospiraceae bacterium]|nr:sigma-70 family RNA polymerase sigma factor [Oscillospiraceae bacterium]
MDKQAYTEAVRRNSQRVFLLALSFTRQRQDAEDVMQTVFLKLWKHPVAFSDETHMDKWLTRVTVNESRSLLRARARDPISYDELEALGAVAEQPEERELIAAVMQLPESLRAVIHLHYYEDLPVKEIADLLKISQAAVKMRLLRGRNLLKSALTEGELK